MVHNMFLNIIIYYCMYTEFGLIAREKHVYAPRYYYCIRKCTIQTICTYTCVLTATERQWKWWRLPPPMCLQRKGILDV